MPDDEDDAVAYQLVCCGDRLIRVAEVVGHDELDLLAEEAAFAVEISGRHPGAALELLRLSPRRVISRRSPGGAAASAVSAGDARARPRPRRRAAA